MAKQKRSKFLQICSKIFCCILVLFVCITFSGCSGAGSGGMDTNPGGGIDNPSNNVDNPGNPEGSTDISYRNALEFVDSIKALYVKEKADLTDSPEITGLYNEVSRIILSGLAIAYGPGYQIYAKDITNAETIAATQANSIAVPTYDKLYAVEGSGLLEKTIKTANGENVVGDHAGFLAKVDTTDPLNTITISNPSPVNWAKQNGDMYNWGAGGDIKTGTYDAITRDSWKMVNSNWSKVPPTESGDTSCDPVLGNNSTGLSTPSVDATITKKLIALVEKNIDNMSLEIAKITSTLETSKKPTADYNTLFSEITHKGLFSSELKELKNFVLDNVIGKDKVAADDAKMPGYGANNPFLFDTQYVLTTQVMGPDGNPLPGNYLKETYVFDRNFDGKYNAPPDGTKIDPSFKNYRGYVEEIFDVVAKWLTETTKNSDGTDGKLVNVKNGVVKYDTATKDNTPTVVNLLVGTDTYPVTSTYTASGKYINSEIVGADSRVIKNPENRNKQETEYSLPKKQYMMIAYEFKTQIIHKVGGKEVVEPIPNLYLSMGRFYIGNYNDSDIKKFFIENGGAKSEFTADLAGYEKYDVFYEYETLYKSADPNGTQINKNTEKIMSGFFLPFSATGPDAMKQTNGKAWLGNLSAINDMKNSKIKTGTVVDIETQLMPAIKVDKINTATKSIGFTVDNSNLIDVLMVAYHQNKGYAPFSIHNLGDIGLDTTVPSVSN